MAVIFEATIDHLNWFYANVDEYVIPHFHLVVVEALKQGICDKIDVQTTATKAAK